MSGSDEEVKSKERTVLRVGDAEVELTFDDAKAIQKALLDYLEQSSYEDRDELLKWSDPAFIDGDGTLRVGLWVLGADAKQMFLRFREPPGQFAGKAHKAILARTDGTWKVTDLMTERIRVRR